MKGGTLKLHFKLIRMARGMLNAWEVWAVDEAIEVGLFELIKDADPVAYHKLANTTPPKRAETQP